MQVSGIAEDMIRDVVAGSGMFFGSGTSEEECFSDTRNVERDTHECLSDTRSVFRYVGRGPSVLE